eukprot:6166973-Karenia_brevis.AAC.1
MMGMMGVICFATEHPVSHRHCTPCMEMASPALFRNPAGTQSTDNLTVITVIIEMHRKSLDDDDDDDDDDE